MTAGGRAAFVDATLEGVTSTPESEPGAVQHGETRIEYTVVRSGRRRRTIGITLEDSGAVVVRAPLRASRAVVADVVARKAGWIVRKHGEVRQRPLAAEVMELGEEEMRATLERAQAVLEAAVERWAPVVGQKPGRVLVRNQKRIWGSCARDGTLRFNWRLLMLTPSLIDYVVVHELTHLRVRSHSREFWSAVAAVLPDFKEQRARLREMRLL